MKNKEICISGTGCALGDFLYNGISFNSSSFKKFASKESGDGGISPGKLVFTEELEKFAGMPYSGVLQEITGNRSPDKFNIGGPGLVSFIHVSQLLDPVGFRVKFHGNTGKDDTAGMILSLLKKTPLDISCYTSRSNKPAPFTHVLSDPDFHDGQGERVFINNIGASLDLFPETLDDDFFRSQITCFGGTALVPNIHDNLEELLLRCKENNAVTVVNTVFDFRNEKKNPGQPWPLVDNYRLIDVLIMDREEALRISGMNTIEKAAGFFAGNGLSSFFITSGADKIAAYSDGDLFRRLDLSYFPVSDLIDPAFRRKGDTTGCGDNFAGGVISSLALSMNNSLPGDYDVIHALSTAVASGGFACSYIGGTWFENFPGEKAGIIEEIRKKYQLQIGY